MAPDSPPRTSGGEPSLDTGLTKEAEVRPARAGVSHG